MPSEPFGRQLRPVRVTITDGEEIDRSYWAGRIRTFLNNSCSCCTNQIATTRAVEAFTIYPDANND